MLTISTTYKPATDLGYLLHKNPARLHTTHLPFGQAHVFYPEASEERCTAALVLEINPVDLIRPKRSSSSGTLRSYVNDRPYAATSFLSVALLRTLGTAMSGRSKERPELAELPLPLRTTLRSLYSSGGETLLRRLFEPLGYSVNVQGHLLDEKILAWGDSRYFTLTLESTCKLSALLTHLYVLVPVLDDEKHYWVGTDEVEKLLRRGAGWLAAHPERDLIVRRYLKHQRGLAREAMARLTEIEEACDPDETQEQREAEELEVERPIKLNELRLQAVVRTLKELGVRSVIDVGCGAGSLLRELTKDRTFERIAGMDVSMGALKRAAERLRLDDQPAHLRSRVQLFHGSLVYLDRRLAGYEAATAVEVIEHLDPWRLATFEEVMFGHASPRFVIITTPNAEYNVRFPGIEIRQFRHRDHRFEWTRMQFQEWAEAVGGRQGYGVRFVPIGPDDPQVGTPTQMAIFAKPA